LAKIRAGYTIFRETKAKSLQAKKNTDNFVEIQCMETMTATPVQFTAGAVAEIKRLMAEDGFDATQKLRVGVKGGGCSGLSYVLGFDQQTEEDETFEFEGVPCIMNKSHQLYLFGMEIDWQGGLNSRGFTFTNPNASKTCGCGTSFSV
jgi:iron-sulfur cluster assembly protein